MRTALLVLILVLLATGLAGWWWVETHRSRTAPSGSDTESTNTEDVDQTPIESQADGGEPEPSTQRQPADPDSRNEWRAIVRTVDGEPVADGSEVLWMLRVPAPPRRGWPGWTRRHPGAFETTTRGGACVLPKNPPFDDSVSVLVALGTDFVAAGNPVQEGPEAETILVEPAEPLVVEVLMDEAPVPGALVEVVGSVPVDGRWCLVHRSLQASGDGRTPIPLLPAEFSVQARSGKHRSEAWWGDLEKAGGRLCLRLKRTFTVSAEVEGIEPPREGLELVVRGPGSDWNETSTELAFPSSEVLPPTRLPWLGEGDYTFRFQGPGLVPQEEIRSLTRSQDEVRLHFTAREGLSVVFRMEEEQERPVPGVRTHLLWSTENGWVRALRVSDEQGRASFDDCPPGRHWVRAYADGFINEAHGSFDLFEGPSEDIPIVLSRAGRLVGRVTHEGSPVPAFTIAYWGEDVGKRSTERFTDREDGRFDIGSVPPGEVHVTAGTRDALSSPTVEVLVGQEVPAEVELELEAARLVSGRVVDSGTGLPVARATIQPWATSTGLALHEAGRPARTDTTGRFRDLAIPAGESGLDVEAEGYATEWMTFRAGEPVGLIGLSRVRDLLVRVLLPEGVDPRDYSVGSPQAVSSQAVSLDSSGQARLAMKHGGSCEVNVFVPGRSRIDAFANLEPGQPWEITVPVVTGRTVQTRLRWRGPAADRPDLLWMFAYFTSDAGATYSQVRLVEDDDTCEFLCAAGSRALFSVMDSEGRRYGSRSVQLPEDGRPIEIEATPEPGAILTVLGPSGGPLPSAIVVARPVGGATAQTLTGTANSEGEVPLGHFGEIQVEAAVAQSQGWLASWRILDLGTEESLELRLECAASIVVRATEDGTPVGGVPIRIQVPGLTQLSFTETCEVDGILRFDLLEPDEFHVAVDGDGWWPIQRTLTASSNPPLVDLVLRRRGGLEFHVTQGGLPVQGLALQVESLTAGDDVEAWVAGGAVTTGPEGFVTDLEGTVRLEGAPAGPYRWSLQAGETVLSGEVELVGLESTEVEIVLP